MDHYGDRDGDGFVEYYRTSENGLTNQGWKDSADSIMHADGQLALGPIALCEVQAYVYAAKKGAALLASALGQLNRASELGAAAEKLRIKFEAQFWLEELGTYALALDGDKRPCRVRSSNAGQVLVSGIAAPDRAQALAASLMTPEMFSGWGVRTLSADAPRFNPMSYHNGSVWPHDNALIADGLASYGNKEKVLQLMDSFYHAATQVDLYRLPELFCGFSRRSGEGPTLYPVACSPQAWSAASAFMFLKACLGLSIDSLNNKIIFSYPVLPRFLMDLSITNLETATGSVNLSFRRHGEDASLYVDKRSGNVEVVVIK
jgi:glycogen debranching enzyme